MRFRINYRVNDSRSKLIYKNIAASFLVKGWACLVQFFLVPLTINCLNQYEYGIWLTINSLLIWIDSFDIGLGNGLRNRLAESISQGDYDRGRRQISTTFLMLIVIIIPVVLLLSFVIEHVNTYSFLNVDKTIVPNLNSILIVSLAMVGATFVFKIVGNVYLALQLPAINNLIVALGQTVSLVGILILSFVDSQVTLLQVAAVYTASPLLVYMLSFPVTFTKYKRLRPSFTLFDRRELRQLFSLGVSFFLAQISGLVIFASSNILISILFSPKDVTPYQLAYRYFGLTNIIFTIISAPFWSATTDAYSRSDWTWINRSAANQRKVMLGFGVLLILMLLCSGLFYRIWVGNTVHIPFSMSLGMALYMFVIIYGTCYSNFLCGIGKIRVITLVTILEAIIYIPLAIVLGRKLGVIGIVIALIFVNAISATTNHVQFYLISHGKARGLWNK